mmetsp:Transcript_12532/g.14569  ORF Transcript_12532/g.14569 Transcript_12532/m.14569 type:complete len:136 (+) Transcript_12532:1-408(+)
MTARQLLSILRLSQALSRLRFSDYVAREDVDEAIRLTYMSKSSLTDDDYHDSSSTNNNNGEDRAKQRERDIISRIFNTIRDYAKVAKLKRLEVKTCEAMVLRKGFTVDQMKTCLEEYSNLSVIQLNSAGTHFDFL